MTKGQKGRSLRAKNNVYILAGNREFTTLRQKSNISEAFTIDENPALERKKDNKIYMVSKILCMED